MTIEGKSASTGGLCFSATVEAPRDTSDVAKAGIPPGKSDASGDIGPKHIATLTSGFSARCRPMRPISLVEFQLMAIRGNRTWNNSQDPATARPHGRMVCMFVGVIKVPRGNRGTQGVGVGSGG